MGNITCPGKMVKRKSKLGKTRKRTGLNWVLQTCRQDALQRQRKWKNPGRKKGCTPSSLREKLKKSENYKGLKKAEQIHVRDTKEILCPRAVQ